MPDKKPSFCFTKSLIQQLRKNLSNTSYKSFFHLLSEMHYRRTSPNIFREKMKFLIKDHPALLRTLNPLFPDEYRFSEKELKEKVKDYKELEKFEPSIDFVNELISRVDSSSELRKFYELVKLYKCKEIDESEFYRSAHTYLRGEFHIMSKLGSVLKYDTTPSYIKKPITIEGTSKEYDTVLNNNFSIYSRKDSAKIQTDDDELYYIYEPDRVIKMSAERPSIDNEITWWESRRSELDLVLSMLTVAEEEVGNALRKLKNGKWEMNLELREYLVRNGVKVKMLERMKFEKLEDLDVNMLPDVVNKLKQKKVEVLEAIRKLNLAHK